MYFQRVAQSRFKKKSSVIADQLLRLIRSGKYAGGFKIPPERVIAEQMGVSRPSVREAISALQIVGILETRPGDGTYVADPQASDDLVVQVLKVLEESDSPFENLQARKALEMGVGRLAVREATDEDLQRIKEIWDLKYEKGAQGDYEAYLRYGREFHMAIARATRNRIIETMTDSLLKVTQQALRTSMHLDFLNRDPFRVQQMLQIHDTIVQGLCERDPEKVIHSLERHFDVLIAEIYDPLDETPLAGESGQSGNSAAV